MPLVILCMEMKWTWTEFQNQPQWFIDEMLGYLIAKSAHLDRANKK